MTEFTEDGFLNGLVRVRQPKRGFRSGLDAVMLAAAVPAESGNEILELGCGAGAASLCLAARVGGCRVQGMDSDKGLVCLANENAALNHLSARVQFGEGNVLNAPRVFRKAFDHVFSNPPFHGGAGKPSPQPRRAAALHEAVELRQWLLAAAKRVKPNGTFTTILRADRLDEALSSLGGNGLKIFPLWPRPEQPAKRVILQLNRDARTPLRLLPGLILHCPDGTYTDEAEGILRGETVMRLIADYK